MHVSGHALSCCLSFLFVSSLCPHRQFSLKALTNSSRYSNKRKADEVGLVEDGPTGRVEDATKAHVVNGSTGLVEDGPTGRVEDATKAHVVNGSTGLVEDGPTGRDGPTGQWEKQVNHHDEIDNCVRERVSVYYMFIYLYVCLAMLTYYSDDSDKVEDTGMQQEEESDLMPPTLSGSTSSPGTSELMKVIKTCADWKIHIPVDEASNNIFCSRCTNRSTDFYECPDCGENVCSYYCFDIDGEQDNCWKCQGCELGKEARVVSQPKYTLADIEELVRVWREGFNCENRWSDIVHVLHPKSNGQQWGYEEIKSLWKKGTTDVLECTEDGRRVPLRDLVQDGYFTPNEVNIQDVRVSNAEPSVKVDRRIHTHDVRASNFHHQLRYQFSVKGKKGNFVSPDCLTMDAGTANSSQAVQDQVTLRTRNVIINSWFLSLCLVARPFMLLIVSEEHHAEIEDDEDRNEYDLSGIPIATKRASISTFLHIVMGVPDTVTLPPLVDSEEIVQTYLDEAVDLMRCIANTNFDEHENRIRQDLADVIEAVSMCSCACSMLPLVSNTTSLSCYSLLHHNRESVFHRRASSY